MKSMLQHSFVLDALETTGADTFSHFEVLVEEHIRMEGSSQPSRLQQLVPTIGVFHTPLPLREAFQIYNDKHHLTKRKHIQISFNEIRHILNLAQIMAMRRQVVTCKETFAIMTRSTWDLSVERAHGDDDGTNARAHLNRGSAEPGSKDGILTPSQLNGPKLVSFDGDQTLYADGSNFDENHKLAKYMELLLRHGTIVAIVTAAGYEYMVEKYEYRISGLLQYFAKQKLSAEECERFYLFGGECNYLLRLEADYHLHPVKEVGPGGWKTSTQYLPDTPGNWEEAKITTLLDVVEQKANDVVRDLGLRGRVIRKRRSVGLVPNPDSEITRESLDEAVLCYQEVLHGMNGGTGPGLPYCAFNGGSDAWVDVGNKRVGVQILQSYLGILPNETLHIGDQFLNTGNDYAARAVCPCIWIINPKETTYILKAMLRLANVTFHKETEGSSPEKEELNATANAEEGAVKSPSSVDFGEMERRAQAVMKMDVYTGELVNRA